MSQPYFAPGFAKKGDPVNQPFVEIATTRWRAGAVREFDENCKL
jgi:hypothetical protein